MHLSDNGIRLIKRFEGYHRRLPDGGCIAYRCPANVWTIGYGTTSGVAAGLIWTEAQAEAALRDDVGRFEAAVHRLVSAPLNQNQFDALVSFTYNVGEGNLAKSSVLRCVNSGDMAGAARAFHLWNKAKGKVLAGLVERRAREAALFARPVPEEEAIAVPNMPQEVDPPADKPVGSRKIATARMGENTLLGRRATSSRASAAASARSAGAPRSISTSASSSRWPVPPSPSSGRTSFSTCARSRSAPGRSPAASSARA
jgi:lysozyme